MQRTTVITVPSAGCFAGFTAVAQAQDADRMQKAMAAFEERFNEADVDHDGKLTPAEAKAKMPKVSEHFSDIDADKDGTVTKGEIASFMQARMAERKAAK